MGLIWIIDDDDIFQFITRKSIEKIDTTQDIISFSNGEEAFQSINSAARQQKDIPDIILLDINMPVMDGWEFLNEYSKINEQTGKKPYIYMVSSSIDNKDLAKANNSIFVTDYITKPIDDLKMKDLIKSL